MNLKLTPRIIFFGIVPLVILSAAVVLFAVGSITNSKDATITVDGIEATYQDNYATQHAIGENADSYVDPSKVNYNDPFGNNPPGSSEHVSGMQDRLGNVNFGTDLRPGDVGYGDTILARQEVLRQYELDRLNNQGDYIVSVDGEDPYYGQGDPSTWPVEAQSGSNSPYADLGTERQEELDAYIASLGSGEHSAAMQEKVEELYGDFPQPGEPGYGESIYDRIEQMRQDAIDALEDAPTVHDLPLFTFSGGSCGSLPGPPGSTDPAYVYDTLSDNETVQCMGKAFMEGCRPTSVSTGGGIGYMGDFGSGCVTGSPYIHPVEKIQVISLCGWVPSASLIAEVEELGLKIEEAVEDLDLTFVDLNATVSALDSARAALAVAEAELAAAIEEEADTSTVDTLRDRVAALAAEVASLEARVVELEEDIEEYEELRDKTYGYIALFMTQTYNCTDYRME